jgi:hypothetical protein
MRRPETPLNLLVPVLAALLAGQPPASAAAAETSPAAAETDQSSGEAGVRVQSFASDVSPTATPGVRVESLLGREIRTRDEDPGRIIDILADRDGQVRAAVVELGGFLGIGTRKIAVDWSLLRFDSREKGAVVVDMTRDQLRLAPEYKPGAPALVGRADE